MLQQLSAQHGTGLNIRHDFKHCFRAVVQSFSTHTVKPSLRSRSASVRHTATSQQAAEVDSITTASYNTTTEPSAYQHSFLTELSTTTDSNSLINALASIEALSKGTTLSGNAAEYLIQAAKAKLSRPTIDALASLRGWPKVLLQMLPTLAHHWANDNSLFLECAQMHLQQDWINETEGFYSAYEATFFGDEHDGVRLSNDMMQQLLVAALGDLDKTWADAELTAALLDLAPRAVELLLSSDDLAVQSEDIVLYTAEQYMQHLLLIGDSLGEDEDIKLALAGTIRTPYLSHFCFSSMLLTQEPQLLPQYFGKQMKLLQKVLGPIHPQVNHAYEPVAVYEQVYKRAQLLGEGAPASWLSVPRQGVPHHRDAARLGPELTDSSGSSSHGSSGGVKVTWKVPARELIKACRDVIDGATGGTGLWQNTLQLFGPISNPAWGTGWQASLDIQWMKDQGAVRVGVFVSGIDLPADVPYKVWYSISALVPGGDHEGGTTATTSNSITSRSSLDSDTGSGSSSSNAANVEPGNLVQFCSFAGLSSWCRPNAPFSRPGVAEFLVLHVRPSGWYDNVSAWAATGLPTAGDITIVATVHEVW